MEIHWRNAQELDEAACAKAEQRLRKLAEHHRDLIDLSIDVAPRGAHHRHGERRVEIRCQARGADLVAHGEADDLGLALRDALRTFRREVERLRARRQSARSLAPASEPETD